MPVAHSGRAGTGVRLADAAILATLLAAGLGSATLAAETCPPPSAPAQVTETVDARSLRLDDGRTVRLAGIEPFDLLLPALEDGEAALTARIGELTAGGGIAVAVLSDKPDRYGRIPALVSAGGTLVQETLAREGKAIAFAGGEPIACFERILAAETEARRRKRGFWAEITLPPATPLALAPFLGRFVIFEGVVRSVGNRRATSYLNFGYRWSDDVTIEISARDREAFGGEAGLAALAGKWVRARGYIEEKGGPMLAVHTPMQLEIMGPGSTESATP